MGVRLTRPILLNRGRGRTARPKTFATKAAAEAYAKKEGIAQPRIQSLSMPGKVKQKWRII